MARNNRQNPGVRRNMPINAEVPAVGSSFFKVILFAAILLAASMLEFYRAKKNVFKSVDDMKRRRKDVLDFCDTENSDAKFYECLDKEVQESMDIPFNYEAISLSLIEAYQKLSNEQVIRNRLEKIIGEQRLLDTDILSMARLYKKKKFSDSENPKCAQFFSRKRTAKHWAEGRLVANNNKKTIFKCTGVRPVNKEPSIKSHVSPTAKKQPANKKKNPGILSKRM